VRRPMVDVLMADYLFFEFLPWVHLRQYNQRQGYSMLLVYFSQTATSRGRPGVRAKGKAASAGAARRTPAPKDHTVRTAKDREEVTRGGGSVSGEPMWGNQGTPLFSPLESSSDRPRGTSSIASLMGSSSNDSQTWNARATGDSSQKRDFPASGVNELFMPIKAVSVAMPQRSKETPSQTRSLTRFMFSDDPHSPNKVHGEAVPTSCTTHADYGRRSAGSRSYQEYASDSASLSEDSFLSRSTNMSAVSFPLFHLSLMMVSGH